MAVLTGRPGYRACLLAALALGLAAAPDSAGAQADRFAYEAELAVRPGPAGPDSVPGSVKEALRSAATLVSLADDPPPSKLGLQRRARRDRQRLRQSLRGLGFYDGRIAIRLRTDRQPPQARIRITTGPRYTVSAVRVAPAPGATLPAELALGPQAAGLDAGTAATGQAIVEAENRLRRYLTARGYPFAEAGERQVVVRHESRDVAVTYRLRPGPKARFGRTTIEGLDEVSEALVRGRLAWQRGQAFDSRKLDATRQALNDLGVFASVRVEPAGRERLGAQGELPVTVTVVERDQRFVGGSLALATDAGLSLETYWGHRNYFGNAERLRLSAEVSQLRPPLNDLDRHTLRIGGELRKPDFFVVRQSLITSLAFVREIEPGFRRRAIETEIGIERQVNDALSLSTAVGVDLARTVENERTERTLSYALPNEAIRDARNDRLNPSRGSYLRQKLTPRLTLGQANRVSLQSETEGRYYRDLSARANLDSGRVVAATKLLLGATAKPEADRLTPDQRFYSGGGAKVRGYAFDTLGPLDGDNDPKGGLAKLETSLALRLRASKRFGAATFLDGGNVYATRLPDPGVPVRWGAGLGLRYFSPVGPIRVDLALPLNPRPGVDAPFHLYISVGQAF